MLTNQFRIPCETDPSDSVTVQSADHVFPALCRTVEAWQSAGAMAAPSFAARPTRYRLIPLATQALLVQDEEPPSPSRRGGTDDDQDDQQAQDGEDDGEHLVPGLRRTGAAGYPGQPCCGPEGGPCP